MLEYAEIIETQGVRIPFDPRIITPKIERPMRRGRYEKGECETLRRVLRPGDRVLELGAGLGLCSTVAALAEGVEKVVAIEANPELLPLIRETHRLNNVSDKVELRNGVAAATGGAEHDFYIRPDFWASSMEAESRSYARVATLPAIGLPDLIAELRPTVLVCDIEGGELGLFDNVDLSGLRHLVLELHPKVYGNEGLARIGTVLACKGFYPAAENKHDSSVQLFERRDLVAAPVSGAMIPSPVWPVENPRVLVMTCMKDEGPFILEWLAWHRALGVTDFVVFTNDCSDGTNRILDHLAAKGEVVHLPNPAQVAEGLAFQPFALTYAHYLPVFQQADVVISMDVDEFLNIRCGEGRLADLFAATGPFDAISVCELNHGTNNRIEFTPGWIRSQFPAHESETPGKNRARRGVKTITRLSPKVVKIRNHRPYMVQDALPPRWLDGSGRHLDILHEDHAQNGMDVRGCYDLVSLEHYALRSLDSFFMKVLRGDVVVPNKQVSQRYFKVRNRNESTSSTYQAGIEAEALAYHARQFESDAALMALHNKACDWHRDKIAEVAGQPELAERREWIFANAWDDRPAPDAAVPEDTPPMPAESTVASTEESREESPEQIAEPVKRRRRKSI